MSRPRPELLAGVALAACVAAAFAPALSGSRAFFQRDVLAYWYPQTSVLQRALAERSWPLWNPWSGFGASLIADSSAQLAYPPSWLALALPLAVQFKLIAAGHCLLAAAGAAALARRLGLGVTAAATAGGAYGLAGPLLSAASLFHHYVGAAWLPWLLFGLQGVLRRPRLGTALSLALLGAAQVVAGSGDMLLCAGLLGAVLCAWHVWVQRPPLRALGATTAALLLAAALALAISAVQWLPTAERASAGFRAHQDARTSTYWSLHPLSALDLAVPRLVAELPVSKAWRARLFEGREPLLACIYLGAVPIVLALLALALGPGPSTPAVAGLALFLVASLGRHTPLYQALLMLPGFGLLRYPQKFLLPAALCLALVAGAGANAWAGEWSLAQRRRARQLAAAVAAAALALVALWWLLTWHKALLPVLLGDPAGAGEVARAAGLKLARSALLLLLVAGLLWRRTQAGPSRGAGLAIALLAGALDLAAVAHGTLALAPAALVEHHPAALGRAGVEPGTRVHAASEEPGCLQLRDEPSGWPAEWKAALAFQDALRPPTGARWAVFGSFDGEFTGLGSPWAAALTSVVQHDLGSPGARRLLRLAGVDRVLRIGRRPVPGLELQDEIATSYDCPLQVLRVPDPLPRARVVHAARAASGVEATLVALLDAGFDPLREVVLEGEPVAAPAAAALGRQPESGGSERLQGEPVEWLARGLDELELVAELRSAGWLVVSEAFDPGWQATVDGQRATLRRADGVFRAVWLAAGRHRVHLRYRPWSVRLGAALTAFGLLAAAALAAALWRRRRRAAIAAAGGGR